MTDTWIEQLLQALNGEPTEDQVWGKASYQGPENERRGFRKDEYGNWIQRDRYGDRSSPYGWEMDHRVPLSRGVSANE